ncbi:DUF1778 domain-containing protein [Mesorhizobium sp.]|uniref:type II toxin-antitoxin system TacA family antitoxin n=1 Tax=Mesorhizobium sp. TaxID=1871066 RepID=UPI0025EC89C4|nr:DUF1778 domain-containing protein [Mesorhizobium sp.]
MSNTALINIRVTSDEHELLEAAARQAHTNLSDFIRHKAVEAAEIQMLDGLVVTIPAADWEKVRGVGKVSTDRSP